MKTMMLGTVLLMALQVTGTARELYKVTVTRVEKDLYRVDSSNPKCISRRNIATNTPRGPKPC